MKIKLLNIGTLVNLAKNNISVRRSILLGLIVACGYTAPALAVPEQLVATTCWGVDTAVRHGQSFTADMSGDITQVNMRLQIEGDNGPAAGQLVLAIFDGPGFGGTQLHSQLVTPSYGVGSVTPIEAFSLTSNVPVVDGNVYTIGVGKTDGLDSGGFCGTEADLYSGGSAYFNLSAFPGADAAFQVIISENVNVVGVDIKPGSFPNSINLCSRGAVPVAILGSNTFDVFDVETESLRFAEAAVKVVGKKDPKSLCSYEDVNGDFIDDLLCHFVTTDIVGIDGESTSVTISGELIDETRFEGTDSVNIVKDSCN